MSSRGAPATDVAEPSSGMRPPVPMLDLGKLGITPNPRAGKALQTLAAQQGGARVARKTSPPVPKASSSPPANNAPPAQSAKPSVKATTAASMKRVRHQTSAETTKPAAKSPTGPRDTEASKEPSSLQQRRQKATTAKQQVRAEKTVSAAHPPVPATQRSQHAATRSKAELEKKTVAHPGELQKQPLVVADQAPKRRAPLQQQQQRQQQQASNMRTRQQRAQQRAQQRSPFALDNESTAPPAEGKKQSINRRARGSARGAASGSSTLRRLLGDDSARDDAPASRSNVSRTKLRPYNQRGLTAFPEAKPFRRPVSTHAGSHSGGFVKAPRRFSEKGRPSQRPLSPRAAEEQVRHYHSRISRARSCIDNKPPKSMTHSHVGKQRMKQKDKKETNTRSRPSSAMKKNDESLQNSQRPGTQGWTPASPDSQHHQSQTRAPEPALTSPELSSGGSAAKEDIGNGNTLMRTQRLWQQSPTEESRPPTRGWEEKEPAQPPASSQSSSPFSSTRRLRFKDTLTERYEYSHESDSDTREEERETDAQHELHRMATSGGHDHGSCKGEPTQETASGVVALWQQQPKRPQAQHSKQQTSGASLWKGSKEEETSKRAGKDVLEEVGVKAPSPGTQRQTAKSLWKTASRKAAALSASLTAFSKRLEERLDDLAVGEPLSAWAKQQPVPEIEDEDDRIQDVVSAVTREILDQALMTDGAIQSVFRQHLRRNKHLDQDALSQALAELAEQLGVAFHPFDTENSTSHGDASGDVGREVEKEEEGGEEQEEEAEEEAEEEDEEEDEEDEEDEDEKDEDRKGL